MCSYHVARIKQLCALQIDGAYLFPVLMEELKQIIPASKITVFLSDKDYQITSAYTIDATAEKFSLALTDLLPHRTANPVSLFWSSWLRTNSAVVKGTNFRRSDMYLKSPIKSTLESCIYDKALIAPIKTESNPYGILLLGRTKKDVDFTQREYNTLNDLMPNIHAGLSYRTQDRQYLKATDIQGTMLFDEDIQLLYISDTAIRITSLMREPLREPNTQRSSELYGQIPKVITNAARSYFKDIDRTPQFITTTQGYTFGLFPQLLRSCFNNDQKKLLAVELRHCEPYKLRIWKRCNRLKLTPKQSQICLYILDGYTYDTMAERMSISKHTVVDHTKILFNKLKARNRVDLVKKLTTLDDL